MYTVIVVSMNGLCSVPLFVHANKPLFFIHVRDTSYTLVIYLDGPNIGQHWMLICLKSFPRVNCFSF